MKLINLVEPPLTLEVPQQQLEAGLRQFAAAFGRAQKSAKKGDINTAAAQTVDANALRKVQVSAKKIDDLCGA